MKYNDELYKKIKVFAENEKETILKEQEKRLMKLISELLDNKIKYYNPQSETIGCYIDESEKDNYMLLSSIYDLDNVEYFFNNYRINIEMNSTGTCYTIEFDFKKYYEEIQNRALLEEANSINSDIKRLR